MPNAAQDGVFESCQGDVQDPVGTYTSDGQTITWSMPDPLTTDPPYTPRIPASSSCTTFSSAELYTAGASASGSASGSAASATATGTGKSSSTGKSTGKSSASATGSSNDSSSSGSSNGAPNAFQIPFFGLSTTMAIGALAAVAILL